MYFCLFLCLCHFSEWLSEPDLEISLLNNRAVFLANSQSDVAYVFELLWWCQDTTDTLCLVPKRTLTFPLSFLPLLKDTSVFQSKQCSLWGRTGTWEWHTWGPALILMLVWCLTLLHLSGQCPEWELKHQSTDFDRYWLILRPRQCHLALTHCPALWDKEWWPCASYSWHSNHSLCPEQLIWVSQHYNIMPFCGEKGGKFSHIFPAAKLLPVSASISS